MDSTSSNFHFPQWIIIVKEIGIPTILGTLIGYLASFISYKLTTNKENKKWRQETAQQIFKEVYSYNAVVVNVMWDKPSDKYIEAVRKINEIEAIADLVVSSSVRINIENIKKLVPEIKKEIDGKIAQGIQSGSRHDLKSGKKYDLELKKLKTNLRKWINS